MILEKQIPEKVLTYLRFSLAVMPQTYAVLLKGITAEELDARPYGDRFTLREAVAHVADWEGVWLERIRKIATKETPLLPGYDEAQWAIDHDYAHSDFDAEMAEIVAGRSALVSYLNGLDATAWQRIGRHGELGAISLFELTALIAGHDGYHAQQIIDYRGLNETVAK